MLTKIKNKLNINKYTNLKNSDSDLENQIELTIKKDFKNKFEFDFDKTITFTKFAFYLIRKANVFYSPIIVTIVSLTLDILNGYFLPMVI
jgi:hypothetical protein